MDYSDRRRRRCAKLVETVEQDPEGQQQGQEREQPKEQLLVDEEQGTSSVRLTVER